MERWWRWTQQLTKEERRSFSSPSEASCKCLLRVLILVLFEETGSLVGNTWISGQFKTGVDLNTSVTNAKWRKTKLSAFLQGLEGLFFFFFTFYIALLFPDHGNPLPVLISQWSGKIKSNVQKPKDGVNKCLLHRNRKHSNLTFNSQVVVLPMQSSWVTADLTSSSWCR